MNLYNKHTLKELENFQLLKLILLCLEKVRSNIVINKVLLKIQFNLHGTNQCDSFVQISTFNFENANQCESERFSHSKRL